MEHAGAGKLRNAGETRYRHQLIYDNRVHDVGGNTDGVRDLSGENAAEIGSVLSLYADL